MNCEEIITSYLESLKEKFIIESSDSGCIIYTPYLDPSNDSISIFVERIGDHFRISDMTQAFEYLFLHGLEIKHDSRQRRHLDITLNRLGINLASNELFINVSKEEIPEGIHRLVEAIKSIDDLIFTAKIGSYTDFGDEVANWLSENKFLYERKQEFAGASKSIIVDFVIPRIGNPAYLYALHAKGSGYADTLTNKIVVNWFDLKGARHNFYSVCVLDDIIDRDVWRNSYVTLKTYTDKVVFWEDRDELKEALA